MSVDESIKSLRTLCEYNGLECTHVDTLENEIIRLKEYLSSISNVIGMHLSYNNVTREFLYEIRNMAEGGLKEEQDETD